MATILKYGNTGLEYIEGSMRYMFREVGQRNGIIITKQEYTDWHREGSLFARILSVKDEEGRNGWDFAYAAEHGKYHALDGSGRKPKNLGPVEAKTPLVNNATDEQMGYTDEEVDKVLENPYLPSEYKARLATLQTPAQKRELFNEFIKDNDPTAMQADKKKQKKKKKASVVGLHSSLIVIIVVMLIVGVGSLAMSGYHIARYLWDARGPGVAATTGIIMALFAAFAFTTGRLFWHHGKKTGVTFTRKRGSSIVLPNAKDATIAFAFWIAGLAVIVFAMFSTMQVNNDDFHASQRAKVEAAVAKDTTVKVVNQKDIDLRAEATRLDSVIAKADEEQAPWTNDINRLTRALAAPDLTEEQITSLRAQRSNAQYNFNVIENRVKADRAARSKIAGQLTGTGDEVVTAAVKAKEAEEKGTLFSLLNAMFGWDIEAMKLIVYVLPAIFYDIMAPFALTVVLILEERRQEENESGPDGD